MRRIYFLILLSFLTYQSNAQTDGYRDKIYLRNGSILHGKVIKYNAVDTIYFALSPTDIMRFPQSMVKKVKMSSLAGTKEEEIFTLIFPTIYVRTQFSALLGDNNNGLSAMVSGGYRFNHWFSAGIGGGISNYYTAQGHNIFPVFGEASIYFYKKNKSPYLTLRSGYGFAHANADVGQTHGKGSIFVNPVIGYRLGAGQPHMDIFCGVRFQSAQYQLSDGWSESTIDIDFRRYDLGIGLTF